MFLGPAVTAITALSPQLPSGLLFGMNEQKPDFLVSAAGGSVVAIGLTLNLKFNFIDVTTVRQSFRGCFISPVAIEVDPASYFTTFDRYPRPGDVVVEGAKVSIAATSADPFANAVHVPWGGAVNVGAGAIEGGFSRWRVVHRQLLGDAVLGTYASDSAGDTSEE